MSLTMNKDACALSLGVELNDDGSIDDSTIMITPSLIRVSYRLTYDEVDEMLEEGIGYSEEWELGALLAKATTRRNYRIGQGSTEGFIPRQIPQRSISVSKDGSCPDGVKIDITVEATHNSGLNGTCGAEVSDSFSNHQLVEPLSSAFTLVTETMILAGEAIGKWKLLQGGSLLNGDDRVGSFRNELRLPFRVQRQPGP
jgi:RNB domain